MFSNNKGFKLRMYVSCLLRAGRGAHLRNFNQIKKNEKFLCHVSGKPYLCKPIIIESPLKDSVSAC